MKLANIVSAAAVALAFVVPAAFASEAPAVTDLSETVAPGDYVAYRVEVLSSARFEYGGVYRDVVTDQPVLPALGSLTSTDGRYAAVAMFAYDWGMYSEDLAAWTLLKTPVVGESVNEYTIFGGGWLSLTLGPGTYDVVVASAPAQGTFQVHLVIQGDIVVVGEDGGESFFARGMDESDVAYDVHLWAKDAAYARKWYYSGATLDLEVEGSLHGYLGYHDAFARWVSPDGERIRGFVLGGEPGDWKADFPEEEWEGPINVLGEQYAGDTREDPPFVLAADVTF